MPLSMHAVETWLKLATTVVGDGEVTMRLDC